MIVRCKKLKPGDGGRVDGCGWQGRRPLTDLCPSCGSSMLKPMEVVLKEGYEAKGPLANDPHVGLVEAMQEYLEALDDSEVRHALNHVSGVSRRGKLRLLHTKVNALVGAALSKITRP